MKVSYNWLKDYLVADLTPSEIAEILTNIGLEIEAIEVFESVKGGLKGLKIGHVMHVEKHPNADKLKLTKVGLGDGEPLSIVCGAPNVAAGQKVIVATVNTTIYPNEGAPFQINKSKIRGIESNGMICAEDEIGLGSAHDGIIVLPPDAPVGEWVANYLEVITDTVFDMSITPNRSDAMSHIGIARDIHAYLSYHKPGTSKFTLPDLSSFSIDNKQLPVQVEVRSPEGCPRYSGISLQNVKIDASPAWMQNRLKSIGVRPINNIVDITNFILHETGQPLHAFDADHIQDRKIIVDHLKQGTKFSTLDEIERTINADDLMICDPKGGLCIAGVFGGIRSGVSEATKNIFLESAFFNPISIRKSAIRHGLRTDAAAHFEKGTDPSATVEVLKRAALLIKEITGAAISSDLVDIYPNPVEPKKFVVTYHYLNTIAGAKLPKEDIHAILKGLEIGLENIETDSFGVVVPTFKNEVTRPADIAEELLRIYGYNNIPVNDLFRTSFSLGQIHSNGEDYIENIGKFLAAHGFYEMINNSMTSDYVFKTENHKVKPVELVNAISSDMAIMRPTLLYAGLNAIAYNHNRRQLDTRMFEFGRVYQKNGKEYAENNRLAIFMSGSTQPENWKTRGGQTDFYDLKLVVYQLLERMGIVDFKIGVNQETDFEFAVALSLNEKNAGLFGKLNKNLLKEFDIKQDVFFADLDWDLLVKIAGRRKLRVQPITKFPTIRRDLALVIDKQTRYADIEDMANRIGRKILKYVNLFDIYEDVKLGEDKVSYAVSFVFEDTEKTLTDKEVDKVMGKMVYQFETELKAVIRK